MRMHLDASRQGDKTIGYVAARGKNKMRAPFMAIFDLWTRVRWRNNKKRVGGMETNKTPNIADTILYMMAYIVLCSCPPFAPF